MKCKFCQRPLKVKHHYGPITFNTDYELDNWCTRCEEENIITEFNKNG